MALAMHDILSKLEAQYDVFEDQIANGITRTQHSVQIEYTVQRFRKSDSKWHEARITFC